MKPSNSPSTISGAIFNITVLLAITVAATAVHATPPVPVTPRDYRAAWCATVSRIDWPPSAGVSPGIVSQQKARMIEHLDALVDMNMNAMYLQVRPAGDAMYASTIEPWSQWLTGSQFTDATYDPLTFAVTEAHKRGIELHAWVNPYRAATDQSTYNKSPKHVTRARPDLCKTYDGKTYMDPGKADTTTWIENVITDLVSHYDIDGVVFDDYFYPATDFNDSDTYQAYLNGGGTMNLGDWRRDNVNRLIQGCYTTIHNIRQSCQFEVGPFGIWRPGYPSDVSGSDYYATHYCDTRKWLQEGWVDSLSPQLYWTLDSPGQPFGSLIDWWVAQNPNRHVMASTADYRVGASNANWGDKTAQQIVDQVNRVAQAGGVGTVHYSIRWLTDNIAGVRPALKVGPYAHDALRPASTWLDATPPPAPIATMGAAHDTPSLRTITFAQNNSDEKAIWWCVNTYNGNSWTLKVLPGSATSYDVGGNVQDFAVSAVDRCGNESARTRNVSAPDPNDDDVVINEILANPAGNDNATGSEFVELYNTNPTKDVDLSGYTYETSNADSTVILPAGTIVPAHSRLTLAGNKNVFLQMYDYVDPATVIDLGFTSSKLANSYGSITIAAPGSGTAFETVNYRVDGLSGWPTSDASSIELKNPASDRDTASNWALSDRYRGTPSELNTTRYTAGPVTVVVDGVGGVQGSKYKSLAEAVAYTNTVAGNSNVINIKVDSSPASANGASIRITNTVTINGDADANGTPCDILVDISALQSAPDTSSGSVKSFLEIMAEGNVVVNDLRIHPDERGIPGNTVEVDPIHTWNPQSGTVNYTLHNVGISGSDYSTKTYLNPATETEIYRAAPGNDNEMIWYGFNATENTGGILVGDGQGTGTSNVTLDNCEAAMVRQNALHIVKTAGTTTVSGGVYGHCGETAIYCEGTGITFTGDESNRVRTLFGAESSGEGFKVDSGATVDLMEYVDSFSQASSASAFAFYGGTVTKMQFCRAWSNPSLGGTIVWFQGAVNADVNDCTFYANKPTSKNPATISSIHNGTVNFTDCIFAGVASGQIGFYGNGTYSLINCAVPTDGYSGESLDSTPFGGTGSFTTYNLVSVSPHFLTAVPNAVSNPGIYDVSNPGNIDWLRPSNAAAYNGVATGGQNLVGGAGGTVTPVTISNFILE